jgi:bifunctional DNase/RNase
VVLEYEPDIGIRCVVVFERADGEASVPCDASDALALAHRLEIPLYVTDDVFSAPAQAASPPSPAREPDDVARWLDHVRPADFREERPEGDFPAG